jgi:type IV pilus assembly protein PilY1
MKNSRTFLLGLMLGLLGVASFVHAEDTDIYSDNAGTTSPPNVLFVLDNAANFEAAAGNCTYTDGTAPSLNGSAGGVEQCALYNVISSLPEGSVNIGLMVYNNNGIRDINNANCGGSEGGCLVQPVTAMTGTVKSNFLAWIKTWRTSGGAGNGYIKASGEATGQTMQEAWAYYAGQTGLSGRTYTAPPAGCQKNFVIFIGNAFTASGSPGDGGSSSPKAALAAAPGVTAAQLAAITIPSGSYGTSAFSCGSYTMGNHTDGSGLYADEWARYMYQTDIYGGFDGNQSITTYTVGLLGPQCKADYPALMTSMAKYGGGKYFATSDYNEISTAILKILNEIQAVNSVFSAASLPVSVNAQGTYLNQIFLGMFRPDASANPRWVGNLKQYQFILEYPDPTNPDPNKATLKLGDSLGNPAISASGTGFITPTAVSFWTKKTGTAPDGSAPDSTGGFFINDPRGAGGANHSPDGELVEKGGAAQRSRVSNLTVNYASTPSSPRKLYTYCPADSGCNSNLADGSNAFATSNTAITDTMLGATAGVAVSSIVRSGTTATVTTGAAHGFVAGDSITISGANESDYNGTFSIADVSSNSFTYPVSTSKLSATGTITAKKSGFSGRTALINWVRGEDNFGDELSPGSGYTIRPSVHGDVLHSRPVVINYGDSRGLVVYYGANDGVFRAINGSQTAAIGSVPAGGELWGLVLREHFDKLNRQRINSPELKLPSTALASARTKDYFVDGSMGAFQKLKADGSIDKAYIYLTMRRGGRFIYALDVTEPTTPKFMWKISSDTTGFGELGQTWSRPRVTLVSGYDNPVLVFGAGYDPAEDAEPPAAGTMGRGIFVIDAVSGVRVWNAAYTAGASACSGTSTQAACAVSGMNWAIPADITFVDRDNDGKTDRFYAADVGGNVWRVDLEPSAGNKPDKWQVIKLAALGCATGNCAAGTTPRKFFFPPSVLSVGATGISTSYEEILLGSGDREHPLKSAAEGSAYNVVNRFYMLKDTKTGKDANALPVSAVITEAALFNASTVPYDGSLSGFYLTLGTGEKTVNAATTIRGTTFFGTNQPTPPSKTSCASNLGLAKGYALNPFTGKYGTTTYDGGGMPPTPTTGVVTIKLADGSEVKKDFCVGCGGGGGDGGGDGGGPDCKSALGACSPTQVVPKSPRRTYWYKQ